MTKTINARDLHDKHVTEDPAYRAAYDALEEEFALVNSMIQARSRAHLTQAQVAERMGTTESAVSRLESGRGRPNTETLKRYADAVGRRLRITLEPPASNSHSSR